MKTQLPIYHLWDLFCALSVIGIWPRFIEPQLICQTSLELPVAGLPKDLDGFKIIQFSDLHLHSFVPDSYLDRLIHKIEAVSPDLIAFTGDFLCYSYMPEPMRLQTFLNRFHAPHGCYAVLGNHDYAECVSINSDGYYDIVSSNSSSLTRAFKRMGEKIVLKKTVSEKARQVPLHAELLAMLKKTPFHLLHNVTTTISVKNTKLNICGLGEYMLGRLHPQEAFQNYDSNYPGIILLHNPDGVPHLETYPGNIILCGHTHGGQVNLPWLWKKFTLLENMQFKKGLISYGKKQIYVNRGIGSILPFRWFSSPEILLITLRPL